MACYSGEDDEGFSNAIREINKLQDTIYPVILQKGTQGNWKCVHPDYPDIDGFYRAALEPGDVAFQFIRREMSNIDKSVANREETRALDAVELTYKFMKIMVDRTKVYDLYTTSKPQMPCCSVTLNMRKLKKGLKIQPACSRKLHAVLLKRRAKHLMRSSTGMSTSITGYLFGTSKSRVNHIRNT